MYIDYDKDENLIVENKKRYNQECLKATNKAYLNIKDNNKEVFCEAQATLYHFVIQQSLVLLIYNKLEVKPNIIGLKYLWDLIQWCHPSIYTDIDNMSVIRKALFNNSFVRSYPKSNGHVINCSLEDIKELDIFCSMIYSLTKKELGDNSSLSVEQ
ncbi:hypothetical protein VSP10_17345 [Myroides odoratimimus]|uniref:hypothetical protein n=1 Tax=Myroides odoratimimus TaxID=76832 RepID=UPI002DBB0A8C|nr:hypothetical protein [Myroides odoratimimus]MEC4054538.1 hypothetical protein [Myroides odoratimimus]